MTPDELAIIRRKPTSRATNKEESRLVRVNSILFNRKKTVRYIPSFKFLN